MSCNTMKDCHRLNSYSGCVSFQKAKRVWAIAKTIDALVKTEPTHANEPHKYAKNDEYLRGANTRVHTYWPPAVGMADESSESVMPMQYEMSAMMIIPYTINIGPPDWIPVTRDAEIPYHELVRPNPIPSTDHTEKRLFKWAVLSEETQSRSSVSSVSAPW